MSGAFRGLIAYPITPLDAQQEVDLDQLGSLVSAASAAGVDGVTVLATSGAGVTFDRPERQTVVERAVEVAGDTPVYTAISAASTRQIVALARDAEGAGAAGLLLAPFAYLPLSEAAVLQLFRSVSDAVALPLAFYNKPLQTQYDVSPRALAELAATTRVVAVKESAARADIAERLVSLRVAVGADFSIGLSGESALLRGPAAEDAWHTGLAALVPAGYRGVWQRRASASDPERERLHGLVEALLGSANTIGALHALARALGATTDSPRGPLLPASAEDQLRIETAVAAAGLNVSGR